MPIFASPDEQFFLSVDWCASLIHSGRYISTVPYSRRYKANTTEDAFFGSTLNNQTTIPACLVLYPKLVSPTTPSPTPLHISSTLPTANQSLSQHQARSVPSRKPANAPSLQFPIPHILVLVALEHGVNAYPHISHGGLIATLLDEAMGMLLTLNGALDDEKRVGINDSTSHLSNPKGIVSMMGTKDANGAGKKSSSSSSSSSSDAKYGLESDHGPTIVLEQQQQHACQSENGKESDSALPAPRASLPSSQPSVALVTKEIRVQYKRPIRTPAVFLISVTNKEREGVADDTESVEKQDDEKNCNIDSKACHDRVIIAGTSCHSATTAAAKTTPPKSRPAMSDPLVASKRRDFTLRATLMDKFGGQVLAIGDAVFAMPKSSSSTPVPDQTLKSWSRL